MRIRSIKPEFWQSPDISGHDWNTRLVFIGLWSYVDDNGVGSDHLPRIAADLFADDLAEDPEGLMAKLTLALDSLAKRDQIKRYTVDRRNYLQITNWHHQRIDKPNKARKPRYDHPDAVMREVGT